MDRKRKRIDISNDASCDIETKINRFNILCSIQNFSKRLEKTGGPIESQTCVVGTKDKSEWCLYIYPNGGNEDSKRYVSVGLVLLKSDKIKVKCKLFILNKNGEKENAKCTGKSNEFVKRCGWVFSKFVSRDYLFNESNGLLINDKLTILCKAEIIDPSNSDQSINVEIPKSKLTSEINNMFDSQSFTDCVIKVEDAEIKVHKAVLAARSPVFHEIFNSKSGNPQKNVIKIETFSVEVVREMLRYIYKDEVTNIQNLAKEMFEISNKYKLKRLKAISERSMCRSLSIGNVCERFAFSETNMIESLRECCQELILKNLGCLIETNEWKEYVLARPLLLESLLLKSLNVSLIKEDRKNEEKK